MNWSGFHPSVSSWFQNTFDQPTDVQEQSWEAIKSDHHTLISAPTGSGKTLAAFLSAIDDLVKQGINGQLPSTTQVVYVSPLKALSNDIEKNLQIPLKGINKSLKDSGEMELNITAMVRTGDTPSATRTSMVKNPPHILVTTPESLYLLLTSDGGRRMLSDTKTIIIDEIHALVQDKRGSHLSLSVERLEHLVSQPLKRIGLSATQKPIEEVAKFLVGKKNIDQNGDALCKIINTGHKRQIDIDIELPDSPLTAVMSMEVWEEIYVRLEKLINEHETTLMFVNTRRLAERLAHSLSERLGEETITAHHGSMSKDKRFDAEQRLKNGKLKALIATASLELGIDIGSVDLVCQISTCKSIAAFLQRVGRAGHSVGAIPKGRIFPLTRDELVESAAMLHAIKKGTLDALIIPEAPIDILAQQIVAAVASTEEWNEDELYNCFTNAYSFRNLKRERFDEVVEMLANGFTTRRGKRGAYIHYDIVNKQLRARKGARLTALTSGGAIPDNFDFDVILEPTNTFIGSINEDYALESMVGDIFQLGNRSWRILKVETGKVRVADAEGLPPSIPFWLGEGLGRTKELSEELSEFRVAISDRISLTPEKQGESFIENDGKEAFKWLIQEAGIRKDAAEQITEYLGAAKRGLTIMPSQKDLVLERFFDEAGDMHVVVHAPFGSRLNKAWGLALRKRFCKQFNFELQAAATEDAIILSLGSTHSFPLKEVFGYLKSANVKDILIQAMLDSPIFEIRWRWNATRALAVLRNRAGKRVPPQLQRMGAEDLIALVFPDQLACFENIDGEREVPEHPLVDQTIHDCLTEAMDIEQLEWLLSKINNNELNLHAKDLTEPSPLAQEIVNAKPYAFLDDEEERRTSAIKNRRWLDPSEASDLGLLSIEAIDLVKEQAWPKVTSVDELHDALHSLGYLTNKEVSQWQPYLNELINSKRATQLNLGEQSLYIAIERIPQFKSIFGNLNTTPQLTLPEKLRRQEWSKEQALKEIVRGRLESLGPVQSIHIANQLELTEFDIEAAMTALENEGFAFQSQFTPNLNKKEWCERGLLARINKYTINNLRQEIEAVPIADYMRFIFDWQKLTIDEQGIGPESLRAFIKQLEGFEAPAVAWEGEILPTRFKDYDPSWLDVLCLSGSVSWGRFRKSSSDINKSKSPIKTTPIMIVERENVKFWLNVSSNTFSLEDLSGNALAVLKTVEENGASFFEDIARKTKLLNIQVEVAISELVARGILTSDSYTGLRALLTPAQLKPRSRSRRGKQAVFGMAHAGRWSILNDSNQKNDESSFDLEAIAKLLLQRYGIVFRKVLEKESCPLPKWRDLLRTYRRMEARGEIRGGYFVQRVSGEQFALPEAVTKLRQVKKNKENKQLISISAIDPSNLMGIFTPNNKVANIYKNRVLYKNGEPIAVLESGEVKFLKDFSEESKWQYQNALIQKNANPRLRAYIGK